MTIRKLEGTNIHFEYCYLEGFGHIVSIYIAGAFYDHKEFETEQEAQAFMVDPFKGERQKAEREAARDAKRDLESASYYARDYVWISRGRQVGPNKR